MRNLIEEIRSQLPFDKPEAYICSGLCDGCSLKLMEFLDNELASWEVKLHQGAEPSFGEIHQLAQTAKKVYQVLDKNQLISKSNH